MVKVEEAKPASVGTCSWRRLQHKTMTCAQQLLQSYQWLIQVEKELSTNNSDEWKNSQGVRALDTKT